MAMNQPAGRRRRPGFGQQTATVLLVVPQDEPAAIEQATAAWLRVREAWPEGPAPEAIPAPLDMAAALLRERPADGCVVFADGAAEADQLFHLIDQLWERALPGVLLFDPLEDRHRQIVGRAAVAMSRSAEPGELAWVLRGLLARQPLIDELRDEVQIAQRFQGGMRGEIDKIHEELNLAASVQREFLPKTLPEIGGVDFGVFFRPAGYVSGDIYDVKSLEGGAAGFFLADAVGHGVPAALMTMVLSRSLTATVDGPRSAGDVGPIPPAGVIGQLNREMIQRHGDVPRFATAVYGVVDPSSRRVTLAGAGHPAPLVYRAGSKPTHVETSGGLLGIFPDDTFDEVSVTLGPDETLVVYSDGFETAFPDSDADAYQRRVPNKRYLDVFAGLAEHADVAGLTSAVERLTVGVNAGAGSLHQIDDLTAILVRIP
jgi:sigma-B regulation protein RsbU (phosphoserine phosphatase)